MLSKPLNKGDLSETHVAYRLALIHSTAVQTDNPSSKLPTKTNQMHHPASRTSFSDTITSWRKTAIVLKLSKWAKLSLQGSLLQPPKLNFG